MIGQSRQLKGYSGGNPFQESQARTFGDDKIVDEFFPTTLFWSLFNEQHEILLGTRGSGKTVLLKMLSYSCLRRLKHPTAEAYCKGKSFIAFYVPLHLEFMASMPGDTTPLSDRLRHFQFAVNCASAKAFVAELTNLVADSVSSERDRLVTECDLVDHITTIWLPHLRGRVTSFKALTWEIEVMFNAQLATPCAERANGVFAQPPFQPIVSILPRLTDALCLDVHKTNWVVCIDEAEFLSEPYQKCLNTFLRSEKRPLIVKMATLPFKHSTRETMVPGVLIEPNGNDFNYRVVDADAESEDFKGLCDHLCRVRLRRCGLQAPDLSLASFLGTVGNDDLIDYFREELPDEADEDSILSAITGSLSPTRQRHIEDGSITAQQMRQPYLKKFAPVYYSRRMKHEESRGNRTVGWFAGAPTVRLVADGNPRRFIQIMNDMVEQARKTDLTPKYQHRVLSAYCQRVHGASEGLPGYGTVVRELLDGIGSVLSAKVHGSHMVNGGCGFLIGKGLLDQPLVTRALELSAAYSLLVFDRSMLCQGVQEGREARLSYLYAVVFWLPMRRGDAFVVSPRQRQVMLGLSSANLETAPITPRQAKSIVGQLMLEAMDDERRHEP